MTAPMLPLFTDPAAHTPEDRSRSVAAILVAGLLRLHRPIISPDFAPTSAPQKSLESGANRLAIRADPSVTVHAG